MLYADVILEAGARYALKAEHVERAAYVITGKSASKARTGTFTPMELVVFKPGAEIVLRAANGPARLMLVGGEPLAEPRHICWNFISSSADRIEQAKDDWQQDRFEHVPGETEFIPLPS